MKKILITGGAGFIGTNSAESYLEKGYSVTILDNFSRYGSRQNAIWLKRKGGSKFKIINADIRYDFDKLRKAVKSVDLILHLAAQVAVTTSVIKPREDFDINALGTFNLLEAVRLSNTNTVLIYASTNKVYGALENEPILEAKTRYRFKNLKYGISEDYNLDFHSPYGCSKGTADQYVHDYSRIYGLNTIVFRQSCIYGPHQFGIEDQGWVAWFMIAALLGKRITIYGSGKQVRDILYIDDLVEAFDSAFENIKKTKGQIYNIGGGAKNSISVWFEFKPILERLFKKKLEVKFSESRLGDQLIFISDIERAHQDFGWKPRTDIDKGIKKLYHWISSNKSLFEKFI